MKSYLVAAGLIAAFVLAACKEQKSQSDQAADDAAAWLERELGWVREADPRIWAERDRVQKNLRFLSVCSMGCNVVGVGELTVRMCYADVPVEMADKTTEAVQSEEHTALKQRARAFAEDYNRLALDNIRAAGEGRCPASVEWDSAYAQIADAVGKAYPGQGFRGDVGVDYGRAAFQIRLPRGVSAQSVRNDLCRAVGEHGLTGRAILEAKSVETMDDYAPIAC